LKLAKRKKTGQKAFEQKREPKMVMGLRKQEAEVSAGKLQLGQESKVAEAQELVQLAEQRVRDDNEIRVELPDPGLAATRRLVEFRINERPEWTSERSSELLGSTERIDTDGAGSKSARLAASRSIVIQGPERIAFVGPNGVGKTSILDSLFAAEPENESEIGRNWCTQKLTIEVRALSDRLAYLPQKLEQLFDNRTVLDYVRERAPLATIEQLRAKLAQFLLRGNAINRQLVELSGGERFRIALAGALLQEPPAQLIVMDEPTNNLDLQSVEQLVSALRQYRGALLVVSHDIDFLRRLGVTVSIRLERDGSFFRVEGELSPDIARW
ncbi:MAG: ATP-binding cassette domain-containing protein, partial [Microbacteriaceae bacterium]